MLHMSLITTDNIEKYFLLRNIMEFRPSQSSGQFSHAITLQQAVLMVKSSKMDNSFFFTRPKSIGIIDTSKTHFLVV